VLWPELIAQWQLSEREAAYVDDQQGGACDDCGVSLRIAIFPPSTCTPCRSTGKPST